MTRRALRLTLALIVAAALGAAGWFALASHRRVALDRDARHAFDASTQRARTALYDVRTGMQAVVASGPNAAIWRERVARDIQLINDELAWLADRVTEAGTLNELDAMSDAVHGLIALNDQAGRLVRADELSAASALVFGDAIDSTAAALSRLDGIQQSEHAAYETRQAAAEAEMASVALVTAAVVLCATFLLVPIGRRQPSDDAAMPAIVPVASPPPDAKVPNGHTENQQVEAPTPEPAHGVAAAVDAVPAPEVAAAGDWPPPGRDRRKATELNAMADVCSDFARLGNAQELPALLERAAGLIDASGFVVWVSDREGQELRPGLAYGYTPQALARLPAIPRLADNATAAAWRDAETHVVKTNGMTPGAVVTPLITSAGAIGVLAVEVRHGRESSAPLRAMTRILAAQLATLVSIPSLDIAVPPGEPAQEARA
jgi:hypothetical protein